jgi:hypothetical protein
VSPTIKVAGKTGVGSPSTGIGQTAQTAGKPGRTEHLGSIIARRGSGISALGGGNQIAHSMNSYGKQPAKMPGIEGLAGTGGVQPTAHAGANMIRGGSGTIRQHVREGGLGPSKMSGAGPTAPDATGEPGTSRPDYSTPSTGDIE